MNTSTAPDKPHHTPVWARCLALCALAIGLGQPAVWAQAPTTPARSALDARLFYQLLLGEISLRQGDAGSAYSIVLDAARRTRDGDLFQRAIQMALQARSGDSALAAARAWSEANPASVEARRFELQILLATNRMVDTPAVLDALVQQLPASERAQALHAIAQTYARVPDKAAVVRTLQSTLERWTSQPDLASAAWTALARLHWAADQKSAALPAVERAMRAQPSDAQAALFALELMENGEATEPWVQLHLQTPAGRNNAALRTAYARVLLDSQRGADARRELQALTREQPTAAEAWLIMAGLDVQDKRWPQAQAATERFLALARDSGDERLKRATNQAYLLLARVAENTGDFAAANAWLDRIENSEEVLAAQIRRASVLARQGQLEQARALLRQLPERQPDDARNKRLAEAQLLRDLKKHTEAFVVYQDVVARWPDDTDLMYEAAMAAERANRLDDMERLLRRVIDLKPDQAHAYNALGYSLADRSLRLPEARQLIEKAVALAPNDAFIRDSLGWVAFREGKLEQARELLTSAYRQQADAEIAAHLGEVLWVMGQQDEAKRIWREGLLLASDNETLLSTLKRLNVQP